MNLNAFNALFFVTVKNIVGHSQSFMMLPQFSDC